MIESQFAVKSQRINFSISRLEAITTLAVITCHPIQRPDGAFSSYRCRIGNKSLDDKISRSRRGSEKNTDDIWSWPCVLISPQLTSAGAPEKDQRSVTRMYRSWRSNPNTRSAKRRWYCEWDFILSRTSLRLLCILLTCSISTFSSPCFHQCRHSCFSSSSSCPPLLSPPLSPCVCVRADVSVPADIRL